VTSWSVLYCIDEVREITFRVLICARSVINADSIPNIGCREWRPRIQTEFLRTTVYELSFTGPNVSSSNAAVLPGVLADMLRLRTNGRGVLRLAKTSLGNLRLRIAQI
jgi:hypothetical protein